MCNLITEKGEHKFLSLSFLFKPGISFISNEFTGLNSETISEKDHIPHMKSNKVYWNDLNYQFYGGASKLVSPWKTSR